VVVNGLLGVMLPAEQKMLLFQMRIHLALQILFISVQQLKVVDQ
jgi:hypothetical protein